MNLGPEIHPVPKCEYCLCFFRQRFHLLNSEKELGFDFRKRMIEFRKRIMNQLLIFSRRILEVLIASVMRKHCMYYSVIFFYN